MMVIVVGKASSPEKYLQVLAAACVKENVIDAKLKTLMKLQMTHLLRLKKQLKLTKEYKNRFELTMPLLCSLIAQKFGMLFFVVHQTSSNRRVFYMGMS